MTARRMVQTRPMLAHAVRTIPYLLRGVVGERSLVSRIRRRVRISECDFNRHMNQAAYAEVAELGRSDWLVRSGLMRALWTAKTKPVVAEQRLVYRRELAPGRRYILDTRATGIDGRLVSIDAHFLVGDRVHAVIHAKLITIGPHGVLDADAVENLFTPFVAPALDVVDWRVTG